MENHYIKEHRRRTKHYFPKQATIKEAFRIKPVPLNWFRGIGSAISVGIPSLIGFLIGMPALGILASIGGFTFLYVANETYAERAVKLFWIALGLTAAFILGSLCSYNVILLVLMFGVVGGLATLLFSIFQVTGPGAMFFVLAYSIGSSMPHDLNAIAPNVLYILMGALFAWIVGMAGVVMKPHGTETRAVSSVYHSLSRLLSSIGTDQFTEFQHQTALLLKQADRTLSNSKFFGRRDKDRLHLGYLIKLNTQASRIFPAILDVSLVPKHPVEEQLSESLRVIATQLPERNLGENFTVRPAEGELSSFLRNLFRHIQAAFHLDSDIEKASTINPAMESKAGFLEVMKSAFQSGTNVQFTALRYGIVLILAAAIAYGFHLDRSYWVPLSSSAVMGGGTYVASLHRGVQRSVGTIIGVLIGAVLLGLHPPALVIPFILAALQLIVELIYGRNYSLAVMFITPSALLIGMTVQPAHSSTYFISARLVDIIIGSIVAIIGTMLFWRKASSSRLLTVFSETVQHEGKLLTAILNHECVQTKESIGRKLQDELIQLRMVYDSSFAESITRNPKITVLWPAIGDCLHLGYMLLAASRKPSGKETANLEERVKEYQQYFAALAKSIHDYKKPVMDIPGLQEYPSIYADIMQMQRSLRVI